MTVGGMSAAIAIPNPAAYRVGELLNTYGNRDELYSGFIPISWEDNEEGSFFFTLAKARHAPSEKKIPLLVWLNGGPGCSSMVGYIWENGPNSLKFGEDGGYVLSSNPHSWNELAHVLYVEQPIRTGFSAAAKGSRTVRNEAQVSEDFYGFLISFLRVFEEFQESPVYISGESYAGMYIPFIAQFVLKVQQRRHLLGAITINLAGIAIGNGAIDPIQDLSYSEYAYSHGLIPLAAKLAIDRDAQACFSKLKNKVKRSGNSNDECDIMAQVLEAAGGPNEYDTGTFLPYSAIVKPGGVFDTFFNDANVQTALNVRGLNLPGLNFVPEAGSLSDASVEPVSFAPPPWQCCNDAENEAFGRDFTSSVPALAFLSEAPDFRVLLYSGERDLNTNFLGTLHTLQSRKWLGKEWSSADRGLWKKSNGDVAGSYYSLGEGEKFAFLIVRNSGHLLPMDLPAESLEMIRRFLASESFVDFPLPTEESYELPLEGGSVGIASKNRDATVGVGTITILLLSFLFVSLTLLFALLVRKARRRAVRALPNYNALDQ